MKRKKGLQMLAVKERVIENTLPNDAQRRALCDLFHYAFVDIRESLRDGKIQDAEALADVFHNIPHEMYGYGLWNLASVVNSLREYRAMHGGRRYLDYLRKIFKSDFE